MSSPLPSGALRRILPVLLAAGAALPLAAGDARAAEVAADAEPTAQTRLEGARQLSVQARKRVIAREIRWLHRRTSHLSQTIRFKPVRQPRLQGTVQKLVRERGHWRKAYRPLRQVQQLPGRKRFARWEAWQCIHRHEGPWTDTGSPYYGGLQMDLQFQRTYGAYLLRTKGTANTWTPMEQVAVAERAYKTRGFHPWPNTARACGLL